MKKRYRLFALCAILALGWVAVALSGCNEQAKEEEFGEWITLQSPSCEEAGVAMRVSINDPSISETRAISAVGHDWNEWIVTTEPTCLLAGVETRTCKTCENSDMRAVPALGHSWGEWAILLDATCESTGTQIRTCLRDGAHTEYRSVDALGHDFGDWVITRAPSCTDFGLETRYCRNCNKHTEFRSAEPIGHNWSPLVVTKAPTCLEIGTVMSVCSNDATHIKEGTIKPLGHSYGDWVITKQPTESECGEKIRVCTRDASHIETVTDIPALGSLDCLTFSWTNDGTAYKVSAKNSNKQMCVTIYIPEMYNGLPVTEISDNGFVGCTKLENIVFLGNNLRRIGSNAFAHCDSLREIIIPEGVTSLGSYAFAICSELKSVSLPKSLIRISGNSNVTFHFGAFKNCFSLENIIVADGNPVFKSDNNCLIERETNTLLVGTINSIIPQYVTSIESYAFNRRNIKSIVIPAGVKTIAISAFHDWTEEQTIIVKGFASKEDAIAVLDIDLSIYCKAKIVYEL
ncbi:MAG: leucine-rich repeat domain-containing protein [Bacteroides sp.]|nr:leucine-rich repeat domain-containing protein [Bacillota bacterium]MCM1393792.1 leucine-rich repeat domain-containing protein [[Eubacterium] siraeum]MCM1455514.1 leucine-rich repeat domain-containing protein [Bacteroides sp.]